MDVRRAADRFRTDAAGVRTWHSFSFGAHYDPDNVAFGSLLACNEELVAAGAGYDLHPHRGVDIVTWVVEGVLRHEDSAGHTATVAAGSCQWLRAGAGVQHSERNAGVQPLRFLQLWLSSAGADGPARYEHVTPAGHGDLVALAADRAELSPALGISRPATTLWLARPAGGAVLDLPPAPLRFLIVASGAADLDGTRLDTGDAVRVTGAGPQRLAAAGAAEVLICDLAAD